MGRKKLNMEEKACALALLSRGMSVYRVAGELNVTQPAIYRVRDAASALPPGATLPRKKGSGAPRKTSPRTNMILRREVMSGPSVAATTIKSKHPELLKNVSIRTIRHRLQKDLGLPARRAAKKPLLTTVMKKKRLAFAHKYKKWTPEDWKKVMFTDERTFRLVRGVSKTVRRPRGSSRFDPRYTVKTVKHPDSVMVWGAYSGVMGRGGLYFLPKNVTMKGSNYIEMLKDHFLPFWPIHGCKYFMHDGAPAHRSKATQKFFKDELIDVLEWPGNSPDLNPIENALNYMKDKLAQAKPSNIHELKEALKKLSYFVKLSESMPERLKLVIKNKGNMTKY